MTAHLAFASFADAGQRAAIEWCRVAGELWEALATASPIRPLLAAEGDGELVGWRLVSDNNCEVTRSARLFPDERSARAAALAVARRIEDVEVWELPEPRWRATRWGGVLDGELVMIAARRYENRSIARQSGQLAVRLFAILRASVAPERDAPAPGVLPSAFIRRR